MAFKAGINIQFMLIVATFLVIQSSTSSPLENEKLVELSERFDKMQTELKSEIANLNTKFGDLQAEKDREILLLKSQIDNLQSLLPSELASNYYATHQSSYNKNNDGISTRALDRPPSSCQEWMNDAFTKLADGIYLVQNQDTRKIEAVFCRKSASNQTIFNGEPIGNVDIKTKSVHFYVQRNNIFSRGGVIPWELERLNEGNAMNMASGIFTAPVPGIYHFEFSGIKDESVGGLFIILHLNGQLVSSGLMINEDTSVKSRDTVSLSASFRLIAGDTVSISLGGTNLGSTLFDISTTHTTHFTGWLVEEDLI